MEAALFVVALVAVVVFVAGIARKLGTSAPLMLTVVGIGLGYLPGVPIIEVEQEVVLLGLLPPLLYAAAIRTSLIDLRANIRSISLLSVGLVVFTALGIGLLVWWLLDIPVGVGDRVRRRHRSAGRRGRHRGRQAHRPAAADGHDSRGRVAVQ